jgi:hypothetical protein
MAWPELLMFLSCRGAEVSAGAASAANDASDNQDKQVPEKRKERKNLFWSFALFAFFADKLAFVCSNRYSRLKPLLQSRPRESRGVY